MTEPDRPVRILVVTDHAAATPTLLAAVGERAARGPTRFRLLVTNPARAEVHLLHPERHDKAAEAEHVIRAALPAFEQAAAGHVLASVSIRADPYDAIEEMLFNEPIDEIMLSLAPHELSRRLHLDLPHRLAHLQLPVTSVENPRPQD